MFFTTSQLHNMLEQHPSYCRQCKGTGTVLPSQFNDAPMDSLGERCNCQGRKAIDNGIELCSQLIKLKQKVNDFLEFGTLSTLKELREMLK